MKRNIFRRGVQMTHRFGPTENDEPFVPQSTFDIQAPVSPKKHSSKPLDIQTHGEYRYTPILSPVVKPNKTLASLNGPSPDLVDCVEMEVPANTKKRTTFRP